MENTGSNVQTNPTPRIGSRALGPALLVGAGVLVFVLLLLADRTSLNTSTAEAPGGAARDGGAEGQMPQLPKTDVSSSSMPALALLPALPATTEGQVVQGLLKQLQAAPKDVKLLQKLTAASLNAGRADYAAIWADSLQSVTKKEQDVISAAKAYADALNVQPVADDLPLRSRFSRRGYALYSAFIAQHPEDLPIRQAQALLYVESGDQQIIMEGIRGLRSLAEEHPEYMPAQLQLGLFSYNTGQFDKGLPRLQKVLEAEPKNALAALYMGLTLVKLNRAGEAKPYFEQVRRSGGNPDLVKQAEQALQELAP